MRGAFANKVAAQPGIGAGLAPRLALVGSAGLLLFLVLLVPLGGIFVQAFAGTGAGADTSASAGTGAGAGSTASANPDAAAADGVADGVDGADGADGVDGQVAAAFSLLGREATWQALANSVLMAAASAFATLIFALPGAWCLARFRFPGRKFFLAASAVGFVLPGILIILGLIAFWGRAGAINEVFGSDLNFIYSPAGIILAHIIFNSSLVIRICMPAFAESDPLLADAAQSLGLGPARIFFAVDLPAAARRIAGAWLLVFLYCFLSFAVVLLFGGVGFVTLEIAVYKQMYQAADPGGAAVLALFQLLWTLAITVGVGFTRRAPVSQLGRRSWDPVPLAGKLPATRFGWTLYWLVWTFTMVLPFVALALRAILGDGFSGLADDAGRLQRLIGNSWAGLFGLSLGLALTAGLGATVLSFFAARAARGFRGGAIDALFTLPLMISGVTLALGYSSVFGYGASPAFLVIVVQIVAAFPVAFRIWREAYAAIPPDLDWAARSLGAGRLRRILEVEVPLLRRSAVNAFVMAATISFADFTAVYVIGQGRLITVPVAIYRLIGHHSFAEALALGVLYLTFTGLVFAAAQPRLKSGGFG